MYTLLKVSVGSNVAIDSTKPEVKHRSWWLNAKALNRKGHFLAEIGGNFPGVTLGISGFSVKVQFAPRGCLGRSLEFNVHFPRDHFRFLSIGKRYKTLTYPGAKPGKWWVCTGGF